VRNSAELQLQVQVLDGGGDATFFISRGDDDGEEVHGKKDEGWKKNLKAEG